MLVVFVTLALWGSWRFAVMVGRYLNVGVQSDEARVRSMGNRRPLDINQALYGNKGEIRW